MTLPGYTPSSSLILENTLNLKNFFKILVTLKYIEKLKICNYLNISQFVLFVAILSVL